MIRDDHMIAPTLDLCLPSKPIRQSQLVSLRSKAQTHFLAKRKGLRWGLSVQTILRRNLPQSPDGALSSPTVDQWLRSSDDNLKRHFTHLRASFPSVAPPVLQSALVISKGELDFAKDVSLYSTHSRSQKDSHSSGHTSVCISLLLCHPGTFLLPQMLIRPQGQRPTFSKSSHCFLTQWTESLWRATRRCASSASLEQGPMPVISCVMNGLSRQSHLLCFVA